MAINMSNGTIYSAPRIIENKDNRSGCPGTLASGGAIITQTFTIDNACIYWTHGRVIFLPSSAGKTRADFEIYVNGSLVKAALDTALTSAGGVSTNWEELDATYMGTLTAGSHTIEMRGSNGSNCWGCGADWGNLTTLIWESA